MDKGPIPSLEDRELDPATVRGDPARLLTPGSGVHGADPTAAERLALDQLGTPLEGRLDRYARLVSDVLDVPAALITHTDGRGQRPGSFIGLDSQGAAAGAMLAGHAMTHRLLEVPETRRDGRFAGADIVTGAPHVRFFAGADLREPGREPLGTLCIMDRRPRRLTETECRVFLRLADVVEQELAMQARLSGTRRALRRSVRFDPLTGLPGPMMVQGRVRALLEQAETSGSAVAALAVRPALQAADERAVAGAGDKALISGIAARLTRCAPSGAEVARLSESWLVVLMTASAEETADLAGGAAELAGHLSRPLQSAAGELQPACDVGVATAFPGDGVSAEELLSRSRRAAEQARAEGNQAFGLYAESVDRRVSRRQQIAARLPDAISTGQLALAYQPIHALADTRILAVEAFARWEDPVLGVVEPEEFVPVAAEDPEVSRALTRFILQTALADARDWARAGVRLNVNVSAAELVDRQFIDRVSQLIDLAGFDPAALTLELTEETLAADLDRVGRTFALLAERGVELAIDDFGIGYASIRYLQRLPATAVKIDRGFVGEMTDSSRARKLVRGIVELAAALDLDVVAEGVETATQRQQLREMGCTAAQGFLFHEPMDAAAVAGVLAGR